MSSGALAVLRLRLDRLPDALEEDEVALDVVFARAFGGGADDQPALLDAQLLQDVLQPRALLVVEPARDAEALALRDEDDEAAGQRDLRRQPCALRLHRILDRLHEDRLALADQVLDLAAVAALDLGADDLVDVEEAVLLEADLDERGLHSGQDVVDLAEVDVAGDRAALGPLEVDLGDLVVLEHGDALLADVDRDDQLALRLRQRCAARRFAAAAAAARLRRRSCRCETTFFSLGLRSVFRGVAGFRAGASSFSGSVGACARRAGGLLPTASAAATAASLRLRGIGCRGGAVTGGGRGSNYDRLGPNLDRGCGSVSSRDVVLASSEPGQAKTPL